MTKIVFIPKIEGCKFNYLLDKRLSLKAKGLMSCVSFLSSFGENDFDKFRENLKEGRDSLRSILNELKSYNYYKSENRKDKGRFSGADMIFHETPYDYGSR